MALDRREEPEVFLRGIDKVIRRDLGKHKELLSQTHADREAFRLAVLHESEKKRFYFRQIGKGKYNDDSLKASIEDIKINIRHMSDKAKAADEKIEHHNLIIETLTAQLADYDKALENADRYRSKQPNS